MTPAPSMAFATSSASLRRDCRLTLRPAINPDGLASKVFKTRPGRTCDQRGDLTACGSMPACGAKENPAGWAGRMLVICGLA